MSCPPPPGFSIGSFRGGFPSRVLPYRGILHACDHTRSLVLFPISPSPLPLPAVESFLNNYDRILHSPPLYPPANSGDSPFSIPSITFRSMFPAVRLSSSFYSVRPASLLTRGVFYSSLSSIAHSYTHVLPHQLVVSPSIFDCTLSTSGSDSPDRVPSPWTLLHPPTASTSAAPRPFVYVHPAHHGYYGV